MKKSAFIILMIMMAFALKLHAVEKISYVKTSDKTYFGTEVKFGLTKIRITTLEGKIEKIPISKVNAYMNGSRLYERLPVVCQGNANKCMALMEFVTSRSGLRLYLYRSYYENYDPITLKVDKAALHEDYYVFKDGAFYLQISNKNAETVFPFFGIDVIL